MINGFYAAKSGLRSFQFSLDVTANNIANVDTEGYQARTTNFADLVYTATQGTDIAAGNGSRVLSTSRVVEQGAFQEGGALSALVMGEGYYAVMNPNGDDEQNISYMRSGSFTLTEENGALYLTAPGGYYVLDQGGDRIEVVDGDVAAAFEQVQLYAFQNSGALTALGDSRFAPSESSGEPVEDENSTLVQGLLERSNVDLAGEVSRMMLAQRGFQANARMLQTIDEIEQTANTLRG